MIVFRCLTCSLENLSTDVLRCYRCGGETFVAEYKTSFVPEPRLQPIAQTIYFRNEPTKPTTEVKFEVTGNSASLNQQNESTGKGFSFSYEDSTNGIGRTDIVRRDSEDADPIDFYSSNIRFGQEQVSRNFNQDLIVRKGILPEIHNIFILTYSLNAQDNDTFNPSRYSFRPDSEFASNAERKHQINFSDPPPVTDCKSRCFAEMMIEEQKTTESSRIQNIESEMNYAGPSQFEPHSSLLPSYPESVITKLKCTWDKGNSSTLDLLNKMGNSSNSNILSEDIESVNEVTQQEAHTSNQQARKERPENACAILPMDASASTSNERFRCRKCCRLFKREYALNFHVQNDCDPKSYKCDKCPAKFDTESKLITHWLVHTEERPFRCDQCDYAGKSKQNLKQHTDRRHRK